MLARVHAMQLPADMTNCLNTPYDASVGMHHMQIEYSSQSLKTLQQAGTPASRELE